MYEDLVETNLIPHLPTTSIQQDLLESFFGRMRSGNNNNNPTVEQFYANFRRTVVNKELTSSTLANCIDKLDILTVSSGQRETKSLESRDYIMFGRNLR